MTVLEFATAFCEEIKDPSHRQHRKHKDLLSVCEVLRSHIQESAGHHVSNNYDLINPWRICAARVTVVGSVCVCVCLLSHISPLERLFILKILSRTQQAMEVQKFVGFSLKPLHCRDPALSPLNDIRMVGHFPAEIAHVHGAEGSAL